MSGYDQVEGLLDPYGNQFELWGCEGTVYKAGDSVPSVGMANTYAVRLDGPLDEKARYLWVQEGALTNLMAHQPIADKSVFDQSGRCVGRGGEALEPPGLSPGASKGMVQQILDHEKPRPQDVDSSAPSIEFTTDRQAISNPPVSEIINPRKTIVELVDELKEISDGFPEPEPRAHRLHLRHDLEIKLELPVDLTPAEADRIAAFVKTLPIPDDEE